MAEVIAERYAKALFDAALEQNQLISTLEDAHTVEQVLKDNPDLQNFLKLPDIGADQKTETLFKIFDGSIGETLKGFLHVLIHKDRTAYMEEVFQKFEALVLTEQGRVNAVVTSAEELSDEALAKIRETLQKSMQKEILLSTKVDPSLIGGVVVRVNDVIYDNSIKSSLARLTRHLQGLRISGESDSKEKVV